MRRGLRPAHLLLALALAACGGLGTPLPPTPTPAPTPTPSTPDPQGTAAAFLAAWEAGDYAGMYSLLSPLSQAALNPEAFQARYQEAARTASLQRLETQVLSALKSGLKAEVAFELVWHTSVVGDIVRQVQMPLVYVDGRWAVAWTDGLILPELEAGGTLVMEYVVPARANIYDLNGLGLAVQGRGRVVVVGVQPAQFQDETRVLAELSSLLGASPEALRRKYASLPPDWYIPLGDAPAEAVQARYDVLAALKGVVLSSYPTRDYPFGGVAPHVVGYLSAIPAEALADYQARGYTGDERVGASGLEAWAEPYLAGVRGGKLNAVTPDGQVRGLAESDPQPAQAVYTTLDRGLQMAAQEALGRFNGVIIVLDPQTGAVRAMASNPTFDPNVFDPANYNSDVVAEILNDPRRPLLNRATQGLYPAGSVYKIPVMAAGMLSGLYTRESTYTCTGRWDLLGPGAVKYDWTVTFGVKPHGKIDLVQALAFSCDPYFYTMALELHQQDPDMLPQVVRQFGLGEFTQIDQVPEAQGLTPDAEWKRRTYGEAWTPGDSVNMGIGQGYVLVTPLQIVQMMAAVRNGGQLLRPQLVERIVPPGGVPSYSFAPEAHGRLPVDQAQLELIREALRDVTSIPGGTARHRFLNLGIPVAGKTGTAEDPAGGAPHAWFAGYTEAERPDRPDIAMVVLVENMGEGSEYAAPIFRRMVEVYFEGRPYTLYPWESEFGSSLPPGATPTP